MNVRLVLEIGNGTPDQILLDPSQTVRIGRNRENTIVLQDEHASRYHAELQFHSGNWILKNLSKSNGTRVNGVRILEVVALPIPSYIHIGDSQIRFEAEESAPTVLQGDHPTPRPNADPLNIQSTTRLLVDDFDDLYRFHMESIMAGNSRHLVENALKLLFKRSQAEQVGFTGLEGAGVPKIILPEDGVLDLDLSRTLTREVHARKGMVWVRGEESTLAAESLDSLRDAVCLPLAPTDVGDSPSGWMGTIHMYHSNRVFRPREVRFAEALCTCLANGLLALRRRLVLESDLNRLKGHNNEEMIGDSPALKRVLEVISRLAPRKTTVLIAGESGVGKELVALALHRQSGRQKGPMVPVNCATITASLADAELFGHAQGAYTGAERGGIGYFQQADDGTLFLDEVGELPLEIQAKLLRVLETGKFRPVRGKEVEVDVRVIAATNRDLEAEVAEGRFRADLFYRLSVCRVAVPPLRERLEDMAALAGHFLRMLSLEYRRPLKMRDGVLRKLQEYHWPGNIRQLRSVLESAVNRAAGEWIEEMDIETPRAGVADPEMPGVMSLESLESWGIQKALEKADWNQTQAAQALGIHRETLMTKMRKYGIRRQ